MSTNYNLNPYYDDFDETKNYQRILFKPGFAVQARELTQTQTILQNQVTQFANHIFKDGTIVNGGLFDVFTYADYVKISEDILSLNLPFSDIVGKVLIGQTTGIKAFVDAVAYKNIWETETDILMISYSSSSEDGNVITFQPDEEILIEGTEVILNVVSSSPTGKGSIFAIESGTVYSKGYFLNFPAQKIILDPTNQTPNVKVGFDSTESIVDFTQDTTLLDPALGSYNYSAPGADRIQLEPRLIKLPIDDESTPNFLSLITIQEGIVVQVQKNTAYAELYEEFARRTRDESGNYVVFGFDVKTREHLDTGTNEGYLTLERGGDASLLTIEVQPGTAYIEGYEVVKPASSYVATSKSTANVSVNAEEISARTGNYLRVKEVVGVPIVDVANTVNLYNTAGERVTNHIPVTTAPSGTLIGTAKIKAFTYDENDEYFIYLFDIKMSSSNTFSQVKAIQNSSFFADVILNAANNAVLETTTENNLLFKVGSDFTQSIRGVGGTVDTSFTFARTFDNITIDSDGTFSVSVSSSSERHDYGVSGSLNNTEKRTIVLSFKENANINLPGTVSVTGNTVTGSSTYFTRLNEGDRVLITDVVGYRYIKQIISDTSMVLTTSLGSPVSGKTYKKTYLNGDIIDLTEKGSVAGTLRTVSVTSNTILSFDLKENYTETIDASVSFKVTRTTAQEVAKILRPNRYVQINCAALTSNTNPINLGFSDVYKLRQIRRKNSVFTSVSEGVIATTDFIFDNGQRDDFYDHATIVPKTPVSNTDFLLIELDYFYPDFTQGAGYFSVDSYPVNDSVTSNTSIFTYEIPFYKSPDTGSVFDLRNHLDFRPVKQSTASDATTVGAATENPTTTNSFYTKDVNGLRIPYPSSDISYDYSYYLARRDALVCDRYGNFNIVQGNSSQYPVSPSIQDGVMMVASLYIPPYPSLSYTLARILNKEKLSVVTNKMTYGRFTMRDLNILKQRVDNLEYYNAINLLEKSASDLLIVDENGLDRFKNGFFVDGFLDHSLGATYNLDYNICVDKKFGIIRPVFKVDSFYYSNNSLSLTNAIKTGNLITLPYTEKLLLEQSRVTTIKNIEQSSYRFIGTMSVTPDTDVWVDETTVDRKIEFGNDIPIENTLSTEWGSWQTRVTGVSTSTSVISSTDTSEFTTSIKQGADSTYNVYARGGGDRSSSVTGLRLIGTYTSYAEAVKAAQSQTRTKLETVSGTTTTTKIRATTTTDTTIEDTTTEYTTGRSGIQTTVKVDRETKEIGSFITDVSVVPYIRPQVIRLNSLGLKGNTRYYVYFDNQPMNDYAAPVVNNTIGSEGAPLISNPNGELIIILRLPNEGKRFTIGTKEILISDNPINTIDATSYAKGYFVASGLNAQKQNTILSTKVVNKQEVQVSESYLTYGSTSRVIGQTSNTVFEELSSVTSTTPGSVTIYGPSCAAYSFLVTLPEGETGTFLTSVDVFIQSKDPTLGVWFEIREMDNAGGITRNQVPYSERWYKSSEVTTTSDATVPHKVTFPNPVYLLNNTQYAFVIHTEGINPNYYFWISRLGETDILTNNPVNGRQLTGTYYTTNNNLNWSIVPDVDLKIRFNRASFSTGVTGSAIVGNDRYEFFNLTDVTVPFNIFGESIKSSDIITLKNVNNTGSNTIISGDKIQIGSNTYNIVNVASTIYYTDGFEFAANSGVTILDSNSVPKLITANVATRINATAVLRKFEEDDGYMILENSSGNFFANGKIQGVTSNYTAKISSFGDWKYNTVNLKPHHLKFKNTLLNFGIKGVKTSDNLLESEFKTFPEDTSVEYDEEYTIKSRSVEVSSYSSSNSSQMIATFSSISDYVSPVIDLSIANAVYVRNLINNDSTGENNKSGGNLVNKYISKTVTLAEGQDAEDLIVYLTVYKPATTDVKVWMKIKNIEDVSETFQNKPYYELEKVADIISSSVEKNDYITIVYKIPDSMLTGPFGAVQYTSGLNTFTGFKQFAVKIGLLAQNSAIVPKVTDLRVIALQR
jgi:hypothetical protein